SAQQATLRRGVILSTCRAAGAPDDPPKAVEIMKAGDVKIPRATFAMAMATAMYDQSQLYVRLKLDDPEKLKILSGRAKDILKTLPESKQTKELSSKIDASLKKKQ